MTTNSVQTAETESFDEILKSRPLDHPDFVSCDDPRSEAAWDCPTVYVPNLVYLLHRLGGPANLCDDFGHPSKLSTQRAQTIEAVGWRNKDESFCLHVSGWHRQAEDLTVMFGVPAQWHLGEWTVSCVMHYDTFCCSEQLARDVALLCDRMIGEGLADPYIY
jgi:hypothetical protein